MVFTIATLALYGAAALFGTIGILSSIMIVKEKSDVLIESFGRYVRTVKSPGLQLKLPWPFQNVARRVSTAMSEEKEELKTKTKDDIFVTLPIKMHLEVNDSKKYNYATQSPEKQVMSRIAATVKQLSSQIDFAELYQARETISQKVRENVGSEIEALYGVKLVDVIVDEPHAPAEIQSAYNDVKASERKMLAAKNNAEAEKIRVIADAEARKEALRLDGEGIALQRKAIFENYADQFNSLAGKLDKDAAERLVLISMNNDTVRDAAKNGNVIVVNTSANTAIGDLQTLSHTMADKKSKPSAQPGA